MTRTNRLFTNLMLVIALLVQPLVSLAQDKSLKTGLGNSPIGQSGASVDIIKLRLAGDDIAEVSWNVAVPAGVEVQGFDVRVDAELSNGLAQTDSKSFAGNARFGSFKFNLPLVSNGGAKPGGGSTGTLGPATSVKAAKANDKASSSKANASKSSDKTPRKFGEGNISGGNNNGGGGNNNTGGNNNNGNDKGVRPILPIPTPTPKPLSPNPPKEQARITSLRAFITAKFASGNDLSAFSEFIQPTDAITGEMKLKGARGTSLQAKKLIHLNSVARLAAECPAGQECFDIIAEARGAEANGQFKVSAEVIFASGVRRNVARTTGNLLRPIRLSVDKIAGTQVANVLVNINGGGNREQFIKQDTQGIAILQGIGGTKK